MISRWFRLALLVIVFATGLLHAQQAYPIAQQQRQRFEAVLVFDVSASQNEKMYEDIEILRRILDRKLSPLYPSIPSKGAKTDATIGMLYTPIDANAGSLRVTQDAQHQLFRQGSQPSAYQEFLLYGANIPYPATIPLRSLEGIYLKGHGVVYTATLSSLHPSAKTEADSPVNVILDAVVVQRVTEWDSIRRQVRNEKEAPKKPEASKPPSLSDVLLKVLAENGHHFSQLGENESLTIVLTVHEPSPSTPAAKSGTGSTKRETKSSVTQALLKEAGDLALLGSMHLKQAKYPEAIAVYQKLLSLAKSPNQEADVRRMLAMCYAGMEDNEKAREEIDKAIDILKKAKESKENPTAAKPAATLPVKLIISAPKKLLDQVKEGKISFEDFRRQASVETLRFGDRR